MKELILDFAVIRSKRDWMTWFSTNFSFPDYFGNNWDGVFDCLSELDDRVVIKIFNRDQCYSDSDYDIFEKLVRDLDQMEVRIIVTN